MELFLATLTTYISHQLESIAQINTNRSLDSIPQPDWDLISLLKIPPLAVHIRSSRSLSKEAQK